MPHAPLAATHRHSIVCVSVCQERGSFCSVVVFLFFRIVFFLLTCKHKVVSPIMVASTAASRTASVMSNSKPRGVIKRRGKPYKTEQHKVVAKKLKLNIEVCSPFFCHICLLCNTDTVRTHTRRRQNQDTRFFLSERLISPICAKNCHASAVFPCTMSTSVAFSCLLFTHHKHKVANLHI